MFKRYGSMRASLGILLMLAAGAARPQASSGQMPPKVVPPESLTTPSQGSGVSDSVITARAKAALLGAGHVSAAKVHVTTAGGVVKLTGHVASGAEKQKAGDVVQGLDGVTSIENQLVVDPAEK